jgi:uncharacterized protein YjbK
VEVEAQFVYLGERPLVVPISLADLELRRSRVSFLRDTYFDSESLALRRAGCSLRIREAEGSSHPYLTFKGPSRKRRHVKRRHETEVKMKTLPATSEDLLSALHDVGVEAQIGRFASLSADLLRPIGQLRNRRSTYRYEHGLHRLDLTWDELEFPTGSPQIRMEVEAKAEPAERLLQQAAEELLALFDDKLVPPERGKTRELCERLYPELLAA